MRQVRRQGRAFELAFSCQSQFWMQSIRIHAKFQQPTNPIKRPEISFDPHRSKYTILKYCIISGQVFFTLVDRFIDSYHIMCSKLIYLELSLRRSLQLQWYCSLSLDIPYRIHKCKGLAASEEVEKQFHDVAANYLCTTTYKFARKGTIVCIRTTTQIANF